MDNLKRALPSTFAIDTLLRQLAYCRGHSRLSFYLEFDDNCMACRSRYELAKQAYALASPDRLADMLLDERKAVLRERASKGGRARTARLSPERRKEISLKANEEKRRKRTPL